MRRILTVALGLVLAITVAGCNPNRGDDSGGGGGAGGAADTDVTLMLPFQKGLSFWSEMLPEELGYYKAEGLTVKVEPSGGGTEALQQLLTGNVDMAMVAPAVILEAAAQNRKVVVPYTDKHKGLFSIVVPTDSPIRTPADLRGKTIGVTDFGSGEMPIVRSIVGKAGLEEGKDVKFLAIGEGNPSVAKAIRDGKVDAYGASWSDFIPLMGLGMKFREVTFPEIQALPSEVLAVRPDYFQANQATVEKVARSMAKASYFVTQFPDKWLGLLKKLAPQDVADPELAKLGMDVWLDIAAYPQEGGEYVFGRNDPAAWETIEQIARESGGDNAAQRGDVDVKTILNDSLSQKINDFSRDEVKKQGEELNVTFP
jgi:NitT/TauT family transport system substrate-binding protein